MGLRKAYHGTPLGATLALGAIGEVRKYHISRGTKRGELSWILEDNMPMRRMIEIVGARACRAYGILPKADCLTGGGNRRLNRHSTPA